MLKAFQGVRLSWWALLWLSQVPPSRPWHSFHQFPGCLPSVERVCFTQDYVFSLETAHIHWLVTVEVQKPAALPLWDLWRAIPAAEHPLALVEVSVVTLFWFSISLCPVLIPSEGLFLRAGISCMWISVSENLFPRGLKLRHLMWELA